MTGTLSAVDRTVVIDVLIPTCNRPNALALVLCALHAQSMSKFRVVVSDQSEGMNAFEAPEVRAIMRIHKASGKFIDIYRHLPRRGLAEQRAFLLSQANAPYSLFLDDDVVLEPNLLARLLDVIRNKRCGFVGSAPHGLGFIEDIRPHQQTIEFWDGEIRPEAVLPNTAAWDRHHLHSAANLFHVQRKLRLTDIDTRLYRIAWIGGCVLFDTAKLRETGGFDFWTQLPVDHCGEDVLAQLRVMQRYGGCGIIPSGAYHLELPTTVPLRDINAPDVLWPAMADASAACR